MEHLLAADVLIGENAALPVVPSGSAQNISYNVCYLSSRVVDKLWQGKTIEGIDKTILVTLAFFNQRYTFFFIFFRNFIERSA